MPEIPKLFQKLDTKDFELAIQTLHLASLALPAYGKTYEKISTKMKEQADRLKEILIETIAHNHPEYPSQIPFIKYDACLQFLSYFLNKDNDGKIYTLNYDLLLYWTIMRGLENNFFDQEANDGFGRESEYENGEFNISGYVTWQGDGNARNQNVHYLHGALHLFDRGANVEKFTWIDTGERLLEQTRKALKENLFPLFVAEGKSDKKLERIAHSGYLYHSFKNFSGVMRTGRKDSSPCLFTYGVSFGENDSHIFNKISKGNIKKIFVGIYGDHNSNSNKKIIESIKTIQRKRKFGDLDVEYFESESAKVWG